MEVDEPRWLTWFHGEFRGTAETAESPTSSPVSPLSSASASPSLNCSSLPSSPSAASFGSWDEGGDPSEDVSDVTPSREDSSHLHQEAEPPTDVSAPSTHVRLPLWLVMQLTAEELRLFIHGLWRADGSWHKQQPAIRTTDVHLRDQLMQVLLHCGFSPHAELLHPQGAILGYRPRDHTDDDRTYSVQHYDAQPEAQRQRYLPITAAADCWAVRWSEESWLLAAWFGNAMSPPSPTTPIETGGCGVSTSTTTTTSSSPSAPSDTTAS